MKCIPHLRRAFFFVTILIKMEYDKNQSSPTAQKCAVRETLIHDTDKNYVEVLQNCRIGKRTANFLACIMVLGDLYGKVSDALNEMYGEEYAEEILKKQFDEKFDGVESVLYGFFNGSVKDNIVAANLNEI